MIEQKDLPIWAKILLGIPVTRKAQDTSGTEQAVADFQQGIGPIAHNEQSVLVFDAPVGKRKRVWHRLMCPIAGKLQS